MNGNKLTEFVDYPTGASLKQACEHLARIAQVYGKTLYMVFEDKTLKADQFTKPEVVLYEYTNYSELKNGEVETRNKLVETWHALVEYKKLIQDWETVKLMPLHNGGISEQIRWSKKLAHVLEALHKCQEDLNAHFVIRQYELQTF